MTTVNRSIELTIYEETPDQSRKEMHDISVTWSEHDGFTATNWADVIVCTSRTWDGLMREILNKEVKLA